MHNLLIVPVFGHKDKSRRPIAILQFVNKLDFKLIDQHDVVSTALF